MLTERVTNLHTDRTTQHYEHFFVCLAWTWAEKLRTKTNQCKDPEIDEWKLIKRNNKQTKLENICRNAGCTMNFMPNEIIIDRKNRETLNNVRRFLETLINSKNILHYQHALCRRHKDLKNNHLTRFLHARCHSFATRMEPWKFLPHFTKQNMVNCNPRW